jgi:hypothetical protein
MKHYTLVAHQEMTRNGKSFNRFRCIYVSNFKCLTKLKSNYDMFFQDIGKRGTLLEETYGGVDRVH